MRTWLTLLLLAAAALPLRAFDVGPLETMPVQEGGRKKPYLVLAQENLIGLAGRTQLDIDGRRQPATEIITSLWLTPDGWENKPLILVENLPLKRATGLDPTRKWFSRQELVSSPRLVQLVESAAAQRRAMRDGRLTGLEKSADTVAQRIARFDRLRRGDAFRVVANPAGTEAPWTTLRPDDPALTALRDAFQRGDLPAFGTAARALRAALAAQSPAFQPPAWKIDLEAAYTTLHPFRWAWILYLAAGLTLALTSLRGRTAGYRLAWVLASVGLAFQLAGFVSRILVAGRPPVANMYESVIWVAFGAMVFAFIFEAIYRPRYFLLAATFAAIIPLVLADSQPAALDASIQPLTPILRSNFWLATHVLIITLSYAAFLLALAVAHISLGKVILGRTPSAALTNYIYRTLQVGVLLLAIGTILGAVWANYSWGRFWDWDPKETWALVALLAYLFLLHGRIAGAWGGFGLALGAILAFQTIIMAWYGVNFVLGVGLHSYGFGSGGFAYAAGFVLVELGFCALAFFRRIRPPLAPA